MDFGDEGQQGGDPFPDNFGAAGPPVNAAPQDNGHPLGDDNGFFASEAAPAPVAAAPAGGGRNSSGGGAAMLDADMFAGAPAGGSSGGGGGGSGGGAPLDADDPRIEWGRQNQKRLAGKEALEKKAREELRRNAEAYLKKGQEGRTQQLSKVKSANRKAEKEAGVAAGAVPHGGSPWERVLSVVDLGAAGNTSKDPFKELSRYKTVLLACKAKNIPIRAA